MTSIKHLHKYKKINLSRKIIKGQSKSDPIKKDEYLVFKCVLPTCNHYIRVDLAEGKMCACNKCGEPMILNKKAITLTRPHCLNCTKGRKSIDIEITSQAIEEFLKRDHPSNSEFDV